MLHSALKYWLHFAFLIGACTVCACYAASTTHQSDGSKRVGHRRPNILLIVADDLGYTDLGAFGGEISTPGLDALAVKGVRFSSFHAGSTCSPTRAMLLSGTDNHIAGLGTMAEWIAKNQRGHPGYEGYLNENVVTVAKLLQDSGYYTVMSGKWHLGREANQAPTARGFTHAFSLLDGSAHHFEGIRATPAGKYASYREDGELVEWPEGRYSSEVYTEKLLSYLKMNTSNKPFFAYLAYTAPHWPLQAPRELVQKYRGKYDMGWDELLTQRMQRAKELGIVEELWRTDPPPGYRPWNLLSADERRLEARKMEVYAAMVESVDQGVGKVLDYLRGKGELGSTIIIFLSDNGPEGQEFSNYSAWTKMIQSFDNSYENIGNRGSFAYLGPNWAYATTLSRRLYKGHVSEGGIQVPAFVWQQGLKGSDAINRHPVTVMDIAPTLLQWASAASSLSQLGNSKAPLRGESFAGVLMQPLKAVHGADEIFAWELFGRRAVRQGDWKILWESPPYGQDRWELFNLSDDPGETKDLSLEYPTVLDRLKLNWDKYAEEVGVILPAEEFPY